MFDKLWEPINIGRVEVLNRIALSPMVAHPVGVNGEVIEPMIRYYEERARGGAGLIITGTTMVSAQARLVARNPSIITDEFIYNWALLVDAIHFHGACASLQIGYGGAQGPPPPLLKELVSASPVPRPHRAIPRELTVAEIQQIIEDFADAAVRAQKAGFDMVELHGANGYLIQQFLSPLTNRRTDIYGVDRNRFYVEILERVKQKVGKDYPVVCGMTSDEWMPGGMTVEDGKILVKRLEAAGAAAIRVTQGTYETLDRLVPSQYIAEEGISPHFKDAKQIKGVLSIPVIGGSEVNDPAVAEQALKDGYVDIVLLGRQLIADSQWPKKAREGRVSEIRKCIYCNDGCIGRLFELKAPRCTVNPFHGWEHRFGIEPEAAPVKKRVVVVGGGPGGMEAALIAGQRGHDVTLIEKDKELGGTLKIASIPEFKKKLKNIAAYFNVMLPKAGVKVKLGEEATAASILALKPDAVILATGGKPLIPDILGAENAITADDALLGKAGVGMKVVVVGGGAVGCDVALHFGRQGKEVTVVEMLKDVLGDMNSIDKVTVLRLLGEVKVTVMMNTVAEQIMKNGVILRDNSGRKTSLPADTTILAVGRTPIRDLYEQLRGKVAELRIIGDCASPRKAMYAIHEAFGAAMFI